MKVSFPAMKARMGGREYYSTTMALSEIPRFFRFNDWEAVTPALRAQRVLNGSRVPVMAKYVTDNEDSYLFSSITCSFNKGLNFEPFSPAAPDIGQITLDLEDMEFVINDGQHRCAAIATALKESPSLGSDRISVLLFPMENLERMQQMFSDLNRYAQRSSKSLNILYDQRDNLAALTMQIVENVDAFRGMVDMERVSIPIRSDKLFTLTTIYDANKELLGKVEVASGSKEFDELLAKGEVFWNHLAGVVEDWKLVAEGKRQAPAVRQEKISTHAVAMRALGGVGRLAFEHCPNNWKEQLDRLREIDWRKSVGSKVNPLWDGVCITAGSVVSNRQARVATFETLASKADLLKFTRAGTKGKRKRGRPRKKAAKKVA